MVVVSLPGNFLLCSMIAALAIPVNPHHLD